VADDKDILGKADALLKRHAAGGDAGEVPVLTDLVDAPGPVDPVEREVFTRVMAEVEKKLSTDLERRVAQQLAPHVHAAVASAIAGLHHDIARAVAEALKARRVK
jgi:hypothetical protein